MIAKLVLAAGLLGVGGYVAYELYGAAKVDPSVYPYSREQAQTMLVGAKVSVPPQRAGGEPTQLWGGNRTTKGVTINMKQGSWTPQRPCEAVITAVAPDKSRVVVDCGEKPKGDSAMALTAYELQYPIFEEYVKATLNKRAFDPKIVKRKESGIAWNNLGGMQREALKNADEAAALEAKYRR